MGFKMICVIPKSKDYLLFFKVAIVDLRLTVIAFSRHTHVYGLKIIVFFFFFFFFL